MHGSLLLCGVSIVGALFLIIILLILKVLLTKLPHTTTTITIWYRSGRAQDYCLTIQCHGSRESR